jgi:hypothetical protein
VVKTKQITIQTLVRQECSAYKSSANVVCRDKQGNPIFIDRTDPITFLEPAAKTEKIPDMCCFGQKCGFFDEEKLKLKTTPCKYFQKVIDYLQQHLEQMSANHGKKEPEYFIEKTAHSLESPTQHHSQSNQPPKFTPLLQECMSNIRRLYPEATVVYNGQ